MIAHIVFDLPLEGPFDYLIPEQLSAAVVPGMRVKVAFGPKTRTGFVIAVVKEASVPRIKPIKAVCDAGPVLDERDLIFAKRFAGYYGCCLGEALALMTRHRSKPPLPPVGGPQPNTVLYHCPDGQYAPVIERLTRGRSDYFIVVPDAFVADGLSLQAQQRSLMGLRSSMFEAFACCGLIIIIDEDNASFKQEQSPMYETRQVVLMAQQVYGFDLAFIGISPSVELMHLVETKAIAYQIFAGRALPKPVVVDLTNYKFLDKKMISPPVRNAIQDNITAKRQTLVVLNRRGNYSVTLCADCGHVLKCQRCDSPVAYVGARQQFTCRHCAAHIEEAGDCPRCGKPNWKSFGIGVEQLQKDLSVLFPTARTVCFEKESHNLPALFDVCIATRAVLRFRGQLHVHTVVLVDFDTELNRADMRSSFKGWSLVQHAWLLGKQVLIQTRNLDHHVLKALARDDASFFYKEELRLRQELGFTPFYHWVAITVRAKAEKSARTFAQDLYNTLMGNEPADIALVQPQPDVPAKVRDQYRFRVMTGGKEVEPLMGFIKNTLGKLKRGRVIVTLNVDP